MNMYEVCAKCGHVGKNNYIEKTFAVKAESGKEAAAKVREFPRVKHDHKDAIRSVDRIDEARFFEIIHNNENDPYFHCKNKQEQNAECELDIKREKCPEVEIKGISVKPMYYYKKQMVRNPRRYMMRYIGREDYAI